MRAAFLGTPAAAVPALAALASVATVDVVITRPDAPKGRSKRPEPPPVKLAAHEWGLEVAQPDSHQSLRAILRGRDLDVAVVVAYGRIIRPDSLATTRVGFVNVHFSLLPRWRGAAPVERAILAGDEITGVSLMVLDEGLDTGPVIGVVETPVREDDTGGSLTARLSFLGAELLRGTLPAYLGGSRSPAPQIEAAATMAPRLSTEEARLDPRDGRDLLLRKVRAFDPRPGAWVTVGGERLKVWAALPSEEEAGVGRIVPRDGRPVLGVAGGAVELTIVQAAGKRPVDGAAWWRGRREAELVVDS